MPYAYIGIGGNLPGKQGNTPYQSAVAVIEQLRNHRDILSCQTGGWYKTAPVPISNQPWYINSVIKVETTCDAPALLSILQLLEQQSGRERSVANAARSMDLDILDFNHQIIETNALSIPHPRLHQRAFVLYPLRDLCPDWCHPVSGQTLDQLIEALDPSQSIQPLDITETG